MNPKKNICLLLLFFAMKANACLNIFAIDSSGRVHFLEHRFFFSIDFNTGEVLKKIKKLEKKFNKGDFDFKDISDYGAYGLMAGNYTEGLKLFRGLLQKHSDVYEIQANIAVAYELNGIFDSAYYWEKKALELRPDAHNNTEWIHLKILEARIKSVSDSNWCLNNNITGITDSIKVRYKFSIHETGAGMWIFDDFIAQLSERFPFTYAEDRVMGKLMMELGDAYQAASVYRSYYCYAIAKYLYPALSRTADEKMAAIAGRYPTGTVSSGGSTYTLVEKHRGAYTNEMVLPDETELNSFINRLSNRSSLKKSMRKMPDVSLLLSKI